MALDDYLNQIARNSGFSAPNQRYSDALYGINAIGRNPPLSANTENHGLTFFTRPDMNMAYDNLVIDRMLANLLSEDPQSLPRAFRGLLDKRLVDGGLDCPVIDNRNAFVPILTNTLMSISGFPDIAMQSQTSPPGVYREEYSFNDDVPYQYGTYDLQATFRNIEGDPITYLFLMWAWYMGLVYEGRIMPHPENVLFNRIDYQTRIYRLVLDRSRTKVLRVASACVCYPTGVPTGNIFNFEGDGPETPFPDASQNITMNFRAMGMRMYDNLNIADFNTVVAWFNPSMHDTRRNQSMRKLTPFELAFFNYSAYPRINPIDNHLEWWVTGEQYERDAGGVVQS